MEIKYAGKKVLVNGRQCLIIDALSCGPECPPHTFVLYGGGHLAFHPGFGWILQNKGQGEWIPELSIYGERVRGACHPSQSLTHPIDDCLIMTE